MKNENEPLAYNATEAAAALHVSRPTLMNLLRQTDFPCFRVGTRWIIPATPLKEWLARQAHEHAVFNLSDEDGVPIALLQ